MDKETREAFETHQRYVKDFIEAAFEDPLNKAWQGADPVSGFKENGAGSRLFSEENWNDWRISLFRGFFCGWFHNGISNEIIFIGDLEVCHQWDSDQNYVFIHNAQTNDLYYATWYKSRGRTDLILHNGHPISLSTFKKLLLEMIKPLREEVF